ncbi:serine/threonine-protein kinase [Nocardia sp. NBC_01388]|uniref:serine/threonine-protein kinase n=1 Tax=Nocardia sp. NBC_01388 TaxID=2903596 RepID=UPI003245DFBE
MVQPLAATEPRIIGRYHVLGLLGSGGMGRVLLGIGPDGRFVAIKQVHPHLLGEHEYRARFRREVTASTRVSGAFTAPVVDFDVDSGNPWLASVFVVGVSLDTVISEFGPLPPPAVLALAAGLAVALQDIHRVGLVHRDLKPANVMLTANGPRVIDFGIAQMTESPGGLTETGSTLGSPAYMSPEQASSETVTAASDMFSLGSLLVMATTGQSPFAGQSLAYTLFSIVHIEPDLERVPPELREIVSACLHKDPRQRPTPAQLLNRIGWLPEGTASWPVPVQQAIQRQEDSLASLTADPLATQIFSRNGSAQTGATGFATRRAGGTAGRRRLRRNVLLSVMLTMILVAAGLTWISLSSSPSQPDAAGSLLTRLRTADTCAWLRQAMQGSVPPESGWPADMSTWKWSQDWIWGCQAATTGQSLVVTPGADITTLHPTGRTVGGLPLLVRDDNAPPTSCERAVNLSAPEQNWGIKVQLNRASSCDFAEKILAALLPTRESPPQTADSHSLAEVDPCGLTTHDELNALVGPLASSDPVQDAHSCQWQGSASVKLELHLADSSYPAVQSPVDLDNGIRVYTAGYPVDALCALFYPYRTVEFEREIVVVTLDGRDGDHDKLCTATKSLLQSVIGRLPKPS